MIAPYMMPCPLPQYSVQMYGDERLKESLIRFSHLPGKQIVEQIIQNALSTAKSQDDDITLVLLKKV